MGPAWTRGGMTPETYSTRGNEIELILFRQLAIHLLTPIFLVDERGALIFYNEPAEKLLGRS